MTVDATAGRGLDDALREQLRFAPDAGQILLYGQRMLLFHASAIFPADAVAIEGETREYAGRHGKQPTGV